MDIFEGLELVFKLIERPQLTETEKELINEAGYSWTGGSIDCDLLSITVEVITLIEGSQSVIFNYVTKLNKLQKAKGCAATALYGAIALPIFGMKV